MVTIITSQPSVRIGAHRAVNRVAVPNQQVLKKSCGVRFGKTSASPSTINFRKDYGYVETNQRSFLYPYDRPRAAAQLHAACFRATEHAASGQPRDQHA